MQYNWTKIKQAQCGQKPKEVADIWHSQAGHAEGVIYIILQL